LDDGFEAPIYFDDKHPETLKGEYLSARNALIWNLGLYNFVRILDRIGEED
jgi:hypothetical protein